MRPTGGTIYAKALAGIAAPAAQGRWQTWAARALAAGTATLGAAGLAWWAITGAGLGSGLAGLGVMQPNTAAALAAGGLALVLIHARRDLSRNTGWVAAIGVLSLVPMTLGALTLLEYATGASLGIDRMLVTVRDGIAPHPGRMAPATATAHLAAGMALLLLTAGARRFRPRGDIAVLGAHMLALVPGGVGYLSLAGYAYSVQGLRGFGPFTAPSAITAAGLAVLSLAMLLTSPECGWQGGFAATPMARGLLIRLIPLSLLLPFVAGSIVVWGAMRHAYDPLYAPALFALAAAGSALALAWHGAHAMRRKELALAETTRALRASEERLRVAQSVGRVGTFEWYPASGRLEVSDEYRRIYGLQPGAPVTTEHLVSLIDPADRALAGPNRLGGPGNPLAYAEYRIARADTREQRWIARRGEILRDTNVTDPGQPARPRYLGVAFDVTERRRAEAALVESETQFRTMVEAMPQLAFIAMPNGYNEFHNNRWSEYTGIAQAEAGGERWQDAVHPDDLAATATAWERSLATGQRYEIEHRLRAANGEYRCFLTRAVPLRDPGNGRITRWLGTSTDVSEIVAARETLNRSREDLERLVAERTADLQAMQQRLAHAQRMEALGKLAGGMAHDFNNIVQGVLGGATLIAKYAEDTKRVRKLAQMINDASLRGASITQRLLVFSRRYDLRAEAIDAEALLKSVQEILAHTIGTGIDVSLAIAPGLRPLLADRGQLETVLVNLATNARDAMEGHGAIRLAAAMDDFWAPPGQDGAATHPAQLAPGAYVALAVTDTGVGMPPDILARASEPFFTTKDAGKGTGLGLAMARGFAEQSGGGLLIQSQPGNGTTVTLWLPAACAAAGPAEVTPSPWKAAAPGQAHVLVVDDDPAVLDTLSQQIQECGYHVLSAPNAAAALSLLDGGARVDVLVADLTMPGMDGLALIAEAQKRLPHLPAILLTGFVTNAAEIAISGAMAGAFTLLRKPIGIALLSDRIGALLETASV
jgi:PAS domain S-box-containing protein